MKWNGKVFGKINGKYIELIVEKNEVVKVPKRHPDTNGVLQLTEKELRELTAIIDLPESLGVINVTIDRGWLFYMRGQKNLLWHKTLELNNFKAILYLADKFEIIKGE